jgi:hypothetical protein
MTSDPMLGLRGPTDVRNGQLVNLGKASQVVVVASNGEQLTLSIPNSLAGNMTTTVATPSKKIIIDFPQEVTSPEVHFSTLALDLQYGGSVQQLNSTNERLLLTMPNGCIEMPLVPQDLSQLTRRAQGIMTILRGSGLSISSLVALGDSHEETCQEITSGYGKACSSCPVYQFSCGGVCTKVYGVGDSLREYARTYAQEETGQQCSDSQ